MGQRSELQETKPEAVAADGDPCRIWVEDEKTFTTRKIGHLKHDFHRHPLLQIDRLQELAKSLLESGQCRFMRPGTTEVSPFQLEQRSPDGRDVDDVFKHIEEPGSWVALYNVESDPVYHKLLWDILGTVDHLIKREESIFEARGFIFISAPPSVTPFHIDRENNFWLQIRGRKKISLWDREDREVVTAKDVDEFIVCRNLNNVRLEDSHRERAIQLDTGPGDGVFFPEHHTSSHDLRSQLDIDRRRRLDFLWR